MRLEETPTAKVVMLGDAGQGKSAIVIRFVTGRFIKEHDPTIEDLYQDYHVCQDEPIILEILDTAGGEEYQDTLGPQWIRESDIFILVYAVNSDVQSTSTSTATPFDQCTTWREKILEIKETANDIKLPIILVANKCDVIQEKRTIAQHTGQQLANDLDCPYVEVSAATGHNLDLLWDTVVIEYRKSQRQVKKYEFIEEDNIQQECCDCNCFKKPSVTTQSVKLQEQVSDNQKRIGDKIKMYDITNLPPDDTFEPIISATNFEIERKFDFERFVKMMFCGLFLPMILFCQTIIFWMYSEKTIANDELCYYRFYPYNYKYNDIHDWIFLDFVGLIVGRAANQDPETVRNRKWFLRQTKKQLWSRMLIMIVVVFVFLVLWYNVFQSDNDELIGVSNMETFGVFILFWMIWILLSLWIGNKTELNPALPLLAKLRSIDLYFGKDLNSNKTVKTTSAYKISRAYLFSENKNWQIECVLRIYIFVVALFYGLIPGITRSVVGDSDGNSDNNSFFTENSVLVECGALLLNFVLLSMLLYIIEYQYTKPFNNYRKWMKDLTMILNENQVTTAQTNSIENINEYFSADLFLSLKRTSNALGWLEIRSFLAVKGVIFFAEQELPIFWILLITIGLTTFIVYRVYFIPGNPLASILFNGVLYLTCIALISLMRIASKSFKFQSLQSIQEKFIGQQKFFMKCRKSYYDDDSDDEEKKEIEPLVKRKEYEQEMIVINNGDFLEDMLYVISKNDIYPRLYHFQLAQCLCVMIVLLVLAMMFIIFKICLNEYSLSSVDMTHL